MKFKLFLALHLVAAAPAMVAGTLTGHLRDPNWYARASTNDPFGVGYYEYAINANGQNISTTGGADDTDVFGAFQMPALPAGSYTVASWDVWWRSAYAFNVVVPASGSTPDVDLRLHATMWGYPAFWDSAGYHEFGQTFAATGPVTMIYVRSPLNASYTLTIRTNGPGSGRLAGTPDRNFSGAGDHRLIYSYGEMPTVAGQTYYVRIRTSSPSVGGVIRQMDPRPDFADPMPGGHLWLGDGTTMNPYPDRDLGLVIMSDDDGLITNMYNRQNGNPVDVSSLGQTFIARGVNLISAAVWLADPTFPAYVVRVFQNGPGGAPVGTIKRGRVARSGDPEMIVTWAPGECPLSPNQTFYLEVTKDGGGVFNVALVNRANPYAYGQAYTNGIAMAGTDLAATIMEEQTPGSAAQPAVRFATDPEVTEANRRTNQLTIQWTTDVASDSLVEYAVEHPPYTLARYDPALVTAHSLTITGLQSHTMYHYQVTSARGDYRPAISRDFVICTRPAAGNLLANPSFEEGSGASPRSIFPGWNFPGGDVKTSSGNHFFSLPPRVGNWFLQYSVNGTSSSNHIFQRVSGVTPGSECTFSAWVRTDPRESSTSKYDVWDRDTRITYVRLGLDPTGGTNVNAGTVRWTPRMYSHRRYTQLANSVVATSSNLTVFVRMQGELQYAAPGTSNWHLYSIDDCVLTAEDIPVRFTAPAISSNGAFQTTVLSRANRTTVIEASTNLTNWMIVTNLVNRTGAMPFNDSSLSNSNQRFFRARQQ